MARAALTAASACSSDTLPSERAHSIVATPNPIQVCGETGELAARDKRFHFVKTGVTTLSWTSTGTREVEIHVGSPAGLLFSRSGSSGSSTTRNWVEDGYVFYMQDTSRGEPLTPLTTLATVTVRLTTAGCAASAGGFGSR
jgi:hypothetical protein